MTKMNPIVKALWVKDLRENPELQGRAKLTDGNVDCCLGRLCRLFQHETGKGEWKLGSEIGLDPDSYDAEKLHFVIGESKSWADISSLPEVSEWAGLSPQPTVNTQGCSDYLLTGLNDNGNTFLEIADLIEEQL